MLRKTVSIGVSMIASHITAAHLNNPGRSNLADRDFGIKLISEWTR